MRPDVRSRPLLVTGSHRSGSTWVGRVLSMAPGVGYIGEPFHPGHRPGICAARFPYWFQHVTRENESTCRSALADTIRFRYALRGELQTVRSPRDVARLLRDWGRFELSRIRRERPLVKDPIALLSAPWLASRFDMEVIVLIRHPAAFASSLKRLNWTFDFSNLLDQDELMASGLLDHVDEMRDFTSEERDVIDQAGLLWKVLYGVVDRYRGEHDDWIFLRHEDLSISPSDEFARLFSRLGLEFGARVRDYLARTTDTGNPAEAPEGLAHQLKRDSRANVSNWKHRLDAHEIARLRHITEPVASRFYSEEDW